jgi:drug/metabolite transporter (DMT)-like permease
MDITVFVLVLAAAACHAGWNALIKGGGDPLATAAWVTVAGGLVAIPVLPLVGLPAAAAWPWVVASVIVHFFYFAGLIEAYRHGDLSQIYPLARGSAPLMTAVASTTLIGERLGMSGWIGLVLLVAGVFLLSLRGGDDLARFNRRGVAYALGTAVTICAYSLIDGLGARASHNPAGYTVVLFVGCSIVMFFYVLARRGLAVFGGLRRPSRRLPS